MTAQTDSKHRELKSAIIEEKKRQVMEQLEVIASDLRYYSRREGVPARFSPVVAGRAS